MASTLWLDESIRGRLLTLGGFFCGQESAYEISGRWRSLKTEMGLEPEDELKYNIPQSHPSRENLDAGGWTQGRRVPAMLEVIRELPIIVIATTVEDGRTAEDAQVADLYPDAFRWVLRGFAIAATPTDADEANHTAVVDDPPGIGDVDREAISDRMAAFLAERGTYAFDLYRDLYRRPQQTKTITWPPLSELRFHECLFLSHARYSDHLQIADVIVGVVRDFVHYNITGADSWGTIPEPTYRDDNLAYLCPVFRRQGQQVLDRGFATFPNDYQSTINVRNRVANLC